QGTMFVERAGYFASADAGVSFHYNFPANYGDVHVGVCNGENYNKAEVNDQKAIMVRASIRPLPASEIVPLRGLRATFFYDGDNYLKNAERTRLIGNVTFEHKYVAAGFEYLNAHDQTSATKADVHSTGYSIWTTPKSSIGWEALLRYDHHTPNTSNAFAPSAAAPTAATTFESQRQKRVIAGAAYWFPHQGSVSSALLVDYDGQQFDNITTAPVRTVAVHALISF